jgi:hypothetical protein
MFVTPILGAPAIKFPPGGRQFPGWKIPGPQLQEFASKARAIDAGSLKTATRDSLPDWLRRDFETHLRTLPTSSYRA